MCHCLPAMMGPHALLPPTPQPGSMLQGREGGGMGCMGCRRHRMAALAPRPAQDRRPFNALG